MMVLIVEQSVECEFAREAEVFGKNLPDCQFILTLARTRAAAAESRRLTSQKTWTPDQDTDFYMSSQLEVFRVVC
jgi:hypothetical protein